MTIYRGVPHYIHEGLGEFCGFVCWIWVFYRARQDVPVLLRWRHPWDHHDPWDISAEAKDDDQYDFVMKSMVDDPFGQEEDEGT